MENFRLMVNYCIAIGLENDASTLKRLSLLSYKRLKKYPSYSKYRLTAISMACGILSARKKSIRRGHPTKDPHLSQPILVSCYGFKVINGKLRIPLGKNEFEIIPLNAHTLQVLSDPALKINSFNLTRRNLSLCVSRDVPQMTKVRSALGVDRNLRNLAVGNNDILTYYDMSKAVEIVENTIQILASFKRNDVRTGKALSFKYGRRRQNRVRQMLHRASKAVVEEAERTKSAIVFEDIRGLRNLYRKGNGQSSNYRGRMNSWPFGEIKRQIEYKAAWRGIPVIHLTKGETRGTSLVCAQCGERLQGPPNGDVQHRRELWCEKCERWFDRDMVAVMNISRRGLLRFGSSQGVGSEAMVQEPEGTTAILKVDPTKLAGGERGTTS